jgi:ornithine cyclodeaminase
MIVTVTASRSPLFEAAWVRPGSYVASMGSDGPGKQELPVALLQSGRLVADLPEQSIRLGEFQHLGASAPDAIGRIIAIGNILRGKAMGRQDEATICVFDSSGIALQDLFLGRALLNAAISEGSALHLGQS